MAITLDEVTEAIKAKGANWEAGFTEVSKYVEFPVDQVNLFGLNIPDERLLLAEARALEAQTFHAVAPPPSGIDWRNHQGRNYVTSVKFQGTCGSCVAFATCACLESRVAIQQNKDNPTLDLSEAHLFFCGCGPCCKTGWQFVPALNWLRRPGVGLEAAFGYQPKNLACPNPQPSPVVNVPRWSAVTTPLARKQAIAENGPVIGGLKVYEDFYFYKSGVYKYTTGIFRGLHAVCVVGYQDGERAGEGYWIIKNSWGAGWGDKGFMNIAYGESGLDTTYPFYDPDVHSTANLVA